MFVCGDKLGAFASHVVNIFSLPDTVMEDYPFPSMFLEISMNLAMDMWIYFWVRSLTLSLGWVYFKTINMLFGLPPLSQCGLNSDSEASCFVCFVEGPWSIGGHLWFDTSFRLWTSCVKNVSGILIDGPRLHQCVWVVWAWTWESLQFKWNINRVKMTYWMGKEDLSCMIRG